MLEKLLAADPDYCGPRVPCGQGHEAGSVFYRDKVVDTVLGPVSLTRAWYHCAACKQGLASRDAELGVAGASLSPGVTAMNDRRDRGAVRGGPPGCWRAARPYPLQGIKKDELATAQGYFENNAPPHALSLVPLPRSVRRIRCRQGRL